MKTFKIEELVLESNEVIRNIDIAYQTFGEMNEINPMSEGR